MPKPKELFDLLAPVPLVHGLFYAKVRNATWALVVVQT